MSQMMQPSQKSGYDDFLIILMSDNPKFVWTTHRSNWVVCWVSQDSSLAVALLYDGESLYLER